MGNDNVQLYKSSDEADSSFYVVIGNEVTSWNSVKHQPPEADKQQDTGGTEIFVVNSATTQLESKKLFVLQTDDNKDKYIVKVTKNEDQKYSYEIMPSASRQITQ